MTPTSEDKRLHLQLLQSVINRMAANSFHLKGWSVVLVTSLFALAASGANTLFVYLAYVPAFAFWGLDGYFLWQERLFRTLYDDVRARDPAAVDYSMDTRHIGSSTKAWWEATQSMTLLLFHGSVAVTILVVVLVIVLLSK